MKPAGRGIRPTEALSSVSRLRALVGDSGGVSLAATVWWVPLALVHGGAQPGGELRVVPRTRQCVSGHGRGRSWCRLVGRATATGVEEAGDPDPEFGGPAGSMTQFVKPVGADHLKLRRTGDPGKER